MDIMKSGWQVSIYAFEFCLLLEKISGNRFLLLDGLCVRTQQNAHAFGQGVDFYGGFLYNSCGGIISLNKKMKMIGHKTPSQEIGVRYNIFLNFLKKEIIVSILKEDGSFIIPSIVNMIKTTFGELHFIKVLKSGV